MRLVFWGRNYRDQIPEDLWEQTEYYLGTGSQGGLRFNDPKSDEATDRGLASVAYYDLLHRLDLDVGIAPLEPVIFNRCKSAVKVMEYGMLGIAAVASRFGPYAEYQAEASEPVVMLAEGTDEWSGRCAIRRACYLAIVGRGGEQSTRRESAPYERRRSSLGECTAAGRGPEAMTLDDSAWDAATEQSDHIRAI